MSKLAQLRRKVNYETNVPRCESCAHVRRLDNLLRDSLPQPVRWLCDRNHFDVKANAVCDRWNDKQGATLALDATNTARDARKHQAA